MELCVSSHGRETGKEVSRCLPHPLKVDILSCYTRTCILNEVCDDLMKKLPIRDQNVLIASPE